MIKLEKVDLRAVALADVVGIHRDLPGDVFPGQPEIPFAAAWNVVFRQPFLVRPLRDGRRYECIGGIPSFWLALRCLGKRASAPAYVVERTRFPVGALRRGELINSVWQGVVLADAPNPFASRISAFQALKLEDNCSEFVGPWTTKRYERLLRRMFKYARQRA